MQEIWKDIIGFEGKYQVSNFGKVKKNKNLILRGEKLRTGYIRYSLKGKRVLGHRLVAEAFIPNPNNLPQVNHIDFNRQNNKVENLEWVSAKQNTKYSFDKGRIKLPYNVKENIRKIGHLYGKINGEKCSKTIIQEDLNGNYINEWKSINEAGRVLKISIGHISDCLKGRCKTYKGYIWKYK